jgi:hypothetical protein
MLIVITLENSDNNPNVLLERLHEITDKVSKHLYYLDQT